MRTRIYLVRSKLFADAPRLVRAPSGATALRHVTRTAYEVRVASTNDMAGLRSVEVEDAGVAIPDDQAEEDAPMTFGAEASAA